MNLRRMPLVLMLFAASAMGLSRAQGQAAGPDSRARPGAAGGSKSSSEAFTEPDRFLRRIEELEPVLERCRTLRSGLASEARRPVPADSLLPECREPFSIDRVLPDYFAYGRDAGPQKILDNYKCLAIAAGNASPCDALKSAVIPPDNKGQGPSMTPLEACRQRYSEALMAKAIMTSSPRAKELCKENCSALAAGFLRADPGGGYCLKSCVIMTENLNSPGEVCGKMSRALAQAPKEVKSELLRGCDALIYYGSEKTCGALRGEDRRMLLEPCMTYAAFRKSHEARSLKLCGADPICRVLMGAGPDACRPYADEIKAAYCGDKHSDWWQPQAKHRVDLAAKRAAEASARQAKVAQLDSTCGGMLKEGRSALSAAYDRINAVLPGTPGREERLARFRTLQKKFEDSAKKYLSKSPK